MCECVGMCVNGWVCVGVVGYDIMCELVGICVSELVCV